MTGGGVRVDSVGNVYLANQNFAGTNFVFSVVAFGPSASGNATPGALAYSAAWTDPASPIAIH